MALLTLLWSGGMALPSMTTEDLLADCGAYVEDASSAAAVRCSQYVLGFLDGLGAPQDRTAESTSRTSKKETWIERAQRTRLGRAQRAQVTERPSHCVDRSVPLDQIITRILEYMTMHPPADREYAGDVLHAALPTLFPCAADSRGSAD